MTPQRGVLPPSAMRVIPPTLFPQASPRYARGAALGGHAVLFKPDKQKSARQWPAVGRWFKSDSGHHLFSDLGYLLAPAGTCSCFAAPYRSSISGS